MKRCPACNRVETDNTLAFCRLDGTALIDSSSSLNSDTGGTPPRTQSPTSEIETSLLPHATDGNINRPTAPTTVLAQDRLQSSERPSNSWKRLSTRSITVLLTIFVAGAIAVGGYFYYARNRVAAIESIAVLPLENRSGSSDTDYLSDGLADSLIYRLSQLPNLKVSPTSSVMKYKGKEYDVAGIAKQLQVDAVLSGRLMQQGDNLSISVQLIDSRSSQLIWAEQYERKMSDLLATQREIAAAIAQKLQLKLSGGDSKGITKHYTESNEAYRLYLRGRSYWNRRTAENLKKAADEFQQAADNDPNFALAYVGLADCYALLEEYADRPSTETVPKARAAALRALQIDDSLAEGHASLGYINIHSWQFADAAKEFQRAIELNPNYATAHQWYHVYYRISGRLDEAFAEIKRAQQLDPLSSIISINVGDLYIMKGDVATAIGEYKKVIDLDPNFARAHGHLGLAYLRQGRQQEALVELQRGVELSGYASELLSFLGFGYGSMGKRTEAMAVLKELEGRYAKRETPALYLAAVFAGIGDKNQAFAWLEKDYQTRTGMLTFVAHYPHLDVLRDDPRYLDLLRRMGLRS